MPTLATLLCAILTDLRAALGAFIHSRDHVPPVVWLGTRAFVPVRPIPATPPIPTETLTRAWLYLGRAMQRLASLYTRWQANTLRPSRSCPPPALLGEPEGGKPPRPRPPRLPRGRAWLAGATDHRVRGHASQLAHLLTQPDAQTFIRAVPRAGRLLRPLCHMLGLEVPPGLALPPRPKPPRRERPPKPPAPVRLGKHTLAQIRRYSPGRIPDPVPRRG